MADVQNTDRTVAEIIGYWEGDPQPKEAFEPDVDDMLAWLGQFDGWAQGWGDAYKVLVNGQQFTAPTLRAALEAAVRSVAGFSERTDG